MVNTALFRGLRRAGGAVQARPNPLTRGWDLKNARPRRFVSQRLKRRLMLFMQVACLVVLAILWIKKKQSLSWLMLVELIAVSV